MYDPDTLLLQESDEAAYASELGFRFTNAVAIRDAVYQKATQAWKFGQHGAGALCHYFTIRALGLGTKGESILQSALIPVLSEADEHGADLRGAKDINAALRPFYDQLDRAPAVNFLSPAVAA